MLGISKYVVGLITVVAIDDATASRPVPSVGCAECSVIVRSRICVTVPEEEYHSISTTCCASLTLRATKVKERASSCPLPAVLNATDAGSPATLEMCEPAGHAGSLDACAEDYAAWVLGFLGQVMPPA